MNKRIGVKISTLRNEIDNELLKYLRKFTDYDDAKFIINKFTIFIRKRLNISQGIGYKNGRTATIKETVEKVKGVIDAVHLLYQLNDEQHDKLIECIDKSIPLIDKGAREK